MNKLNIKALGFAFGITWAIAIFVAGIVAMFGWTDVFVGVMSSIYVGYAASFVGAIIGAVWAFIDGFIGGVIFAWIYNKFVKSGEDQA